ncbi:MAG TPA: hypothetical protein ENN56_00455, partial [Firmicutes bacterium]|nr:hypothetical protein [Bacillota bacterium]
MSVSRGSPKAAFRQIWTKTFTRAWNRRNQLATATLGFWVPWHTAFAWYDPTFDPFAAFGMSLSDILAIVAEPVYAALILVIASAPSELPWRLTVTRSAWLVPRLWLITVKITGMAIVVPYAVLHVGSAVILTWWETYAAAKTIVVITGASIIWIPLVYFMYVLAAPVLVAQTEAEGWDAGAREVDEPTHQRTGVSTGWALRTSRRFVQRNLGCAILVVVSGQALVFAATLVVPPNTGII